MSLIFGIIQKTEESVPAALQQMYEGIRLMPHENHTITVNGTAGFGHLLTYNTPEALFEKSPVYLPDQQLLITSAARLDNRHDLARQLGIRLHAALPDGELIQAAYLKWGKQSPGYLRGDWSFAVYDYRQQELFLARDQHGYTAVYYYSDSRQFAFSSSAKSIFALEGFSKKINKPFLLNNLLLLKQDDNHVQAFENLHIVPPAHTLSFKDGRITLSRYWFPENTPERNYKNADDYAEEFREVFKEAVRVRLRSHKPVASMLSGGMDSGSVSAMAAHLLKQEGKQLTTFSHVPLFKEKLIPAKGSRRLLDETPYIMATANHAGNILPVLLNSSDTSPIDGFIRAMACFDSHFHAASNGFWLVDLPAYAYKQGYGTLLSGEMGNATISNPGIEYLLPWHHPGMIGQPQKLLKKIAKILLLEYYPAWFERRKGSLTDYVERSYVKKDLLTELQVYDNIKENQRGFTRYYKNAKEAMLHLLDAGRNIRCQFGAIQTNTFGLEYRDPTGDLNVVEYCLSIPNHAFFDDKLNNKAILKKMMHGYLPHEVLHTNKKGIQASDILYRVLNDSGRVDELLSVFRASPAVNELIDVPKLSDHWLHISSNKAVDLLEIQTFVKGLMFSYFLSDNGR